MKSNKFIHKILQRDYDEPDINLNEFDKNLNIQIIQYRKDKISFSIDHIDPPIANALRRIMIADV